MWGRQETALGAGDVVPTGPREALARDTWGAGDSSEPAPLARGPHGWEAVCAWHAVCLSVVTGSEGGPSYLPTPWGTASGPRGHAAPAPALQAHTDSLNTLVALHQLYQYTQKYYDEVGGPASPGTAALIGRPLPWPVV